MTTTRGPVVDQLVEAADAADHIVLQHRQQGRLRRVLTGSVASGVASRAKVPVVSVPELWSQDEAWRVLVAVDGVRGNEGLLRKAFEEASTRNATLVALHAWYVPSIYDDALAERESLARAVQTIITPDDISVG
jgi:nucleotide-binding universal stress UspA family protein